MRIAPSPIITALTLCIVSLCFLSAPSAMAQGRPAIVAGGAHTMAIDADGSVWSWGYNGNGQLGDGTIKNSMSPVKVTNLPKAQSVAADFSGSTALTDDGSVWRWGGHKKNSPLNRNELEPKKLQRLPAAKAIAFNQGVGLVLTKNDTVWLLDKIIAGRQKTTPVSGLVDIAGVAVGEGSFFAYSFDCTLWAWGRNNFGQLGIGSTKDTQSPVQSNIFSCLSSLAADNHVLALSAEGSVWSWGYNREGQLAAPPGHNSSQPEQIPRLSNIIAVATDRHSLALKTDGSVWAWGENNYGQLGNGSTKNRATPVQVPGLNGVTMISAGAMYSVALKADGSVWAWGRNDYGQLGDGSLQNQSTPVQVTGFDGSGYLNLNTTSSVESADSVPPIYFTMTPTTGAAPQTIAFQPIFTSNHIPESVEWDFGDGEISNFKEAIHTYDVAGVYIATLTVYFNNHTSRESMKRVEIKPSWK